MSAQRPARPDQAGNSDTLENLARVGLIAFGVVHVLVAWLAIQLAWFGGGGESADQSGAMSTLAESPIGKPLLWIVAIGLIALAAWQAAEVLRWRQRLVGVGQGPAPRRSASPATRWSRRSSTSRWRCWPSASPPAAGSRARAPSRRPPPASSAGPAGQWIVGAAGLVLIGVGVLAHPEGPEQALPEADRHHRTPRRRPSGWSPGSARSASRARASRSSASARLLVWAAVTFDPSKARGLDGALRTILELPFGQILLTLVAIGIAAFGAFCFVRARYPERT